MKNRAIFYFLILFLCVLCSCTKHFDSLYNDKNALTAESTNTYKISEKQALKELNRFLTNSSGITKSNSKNILLEKKISKVLSVRTSAQTKLALTKALIKTKSSDGSEIVIPDTLMYIVNFENDGHHSPLGCGPLALA